MPDLDYVPPTEGLDPLPALDSAVAIRDTLAHLIADARAGRVALRTAAELARLLKSATESPAPVTILGSPDGRAQKKFPA
jgi:hypothetical protein